ncbi:MAG TPA: SDR family oxidoreductase [Solirubrobacteraceae bacterium]|nr:SDR family oxidoreductase [Solirubrobacteraceae bacterium]
MSEADFAGRRAAVTGGAGGIGRAVAELLHGRGASVVACDLSPGALAPLEQAGLETVAADLSTSEGRAALVDATGPCDHLVVCHGIVRTKPIEETTEEDWDAILAVNAKAVYFLCQAFGDLLRDGGSIVTLSSISARSAASLEQSVYCASKAAVSSITRSFAHAYAARGIRVNAVLPGITDTAMQDDVLVGMAAARGSTPEAVHRARLAAVPLGRTSPPSEMAETVVWLLTPAAGYLTGQQIAADGGLTMY